VPAERIERLERLEPQAARTSTTKLDLAQFERRPARCSCEETFSVAA
jgi:hypothetical protein